MRTYPVILLTLLLAAWAQGCALIDEKPVDCPGDVTMTLTVSQFDNVEEELADKLSSTKDLPIRNALVDYITPVFTHTVHDVDFSFFDQRKGGIRTVHLADVIDGDQKTFTVRLPASDYRYGLAGNLEANPSVTVADAEKEDELYLIQTGGTSESHRVGIYSTRRRALVRKDHEEHFAATLAMNNAAAALILNRDSCEVKGIRATYQGMADSFSILDSMYHYDRKTVVKADVIDVTPYMTATGSDQDLPLDASPWGYDMSWTQWTKVPLMVCAASFPSRIIGTDIIGSSVVIWTINLYVDLADGTTTRNDIYIGQPVQAGHLKIIKGWLQANGSFAPTPPLSPTPGGGGGGHNPPKPPEPDPDPTDTTTVVGVSVMLNWKDGMTYEPSL